MRRLVVISNRVADLTKSSQSGGLAVGLADSLRQRGGVWLGWDGQTAENTGDLEPQSRQIGDVTQIVLPLTRQDYEEYYLGFSNSVLWPLFHYRLDLVDYKTTYLEGYRRVNARFADALIPSLREDDLIWIHDYHLIPLAAELRQRGCKQRIGFFLHIPLPPPEMLSAVPRHRWLVESLLQFDVIGLQSRTDLNNLQHYIEQHLSTTVSQDGRLNWGDREVVAGRLSHWHRRGRLRRYGRASQ